MLQYQQLEHDSAVRTLFLFSPGVFNIICNTQRSLSRFDITTTFVHGPEYHKRVLKVALKCVHGRECEDWLIQLVNREGVCPES